MTKFTNRKTQCMSCGTEHHKGHPCPKCNQPHVKRRRKAKALSIADRALRKAGV